jgi:hypothetical protein
MSDKALLWVCLYLVFALGLGIFIGKAIKKANPCNHQWEARGYGGTGWTLLVCKYCGEREISPE